MKKVRIPVIKIAHESYAVPSMSIGADLMKRLASLQRLKYDSSSPDNKDWHYRKSGEGIDLELSYDLIGVEEPKPKEPKKLKGLKGLPDHSALLVECDCGRERISGHVCAHCGAGRKGGVR